MFGEGEGKRGRIVCPLSLWERVRVRAVGEGIRDWGLGIGIRRFGDFEIWRF
jgi:hypothetical protein